MTAEQFLIKACIDAGFTEDYAKMIFKINPDSSSVFVKAMIDFTRQHVTQALNAALEDSPYGSSTDTISYADMKKAILNSYPLNNIQ